MMSLHVWSMGAWHAALRCSSVARRRRRSLPMTAEELLESEMLDLPAGVGFSPKA